ncbi:MAG: family 10 glycosylhydrolase [Verrucomicrobia bacterium]|nr:family 10 glycosylhydrolase [Verrucomicrobiota bacterium]
MKPTPFAAVRLAGRLIAWLVSIATMRAEVSSGIIDSGHYRDPATAQAAWVPMRGTAPVAPATVQGHDALRLPCNFAGTTIERASWDRAVTLDLSASRGVQFEFLCPDIAPISHFSFFFQSGGGWYSATFFPEAVNRWCTVTIDKSATRIEGQPAGWHRITAIRVSAWRGGDASTELFLRDLRVCGGLGIDASVAVIQGESVARQSAGEARSVMQFTESITTGFDSFGVGYATLSDLALDAATLRQAKLVVLPYNPSLPDTAIAALRGYLESGGKLLAFYTLPRELQAPVHLSLGRLLKADDRPARFAAMRFAADALPGAPALVKQRSWNVREATPDAGAGRVVAEWSDDQGQPSGAAAVVATANCVFVTHVLLADDLPNQRRLLLAAAARLAPDLLPEAVTAGLNHLGRIGDHRDFTAAADWIAQQPRLAAHSALADAKALRTRAQQFTANRRYLEALDVLPRAAQRLLDAYCLAQRAVPGEFRAFWCHDAFGVNGLDWDTAIKRLADAGFTAVLPNMLWGGVAFYPSKVLPVAPDVAKRGDQIAQCLAAAKKYGVQVHVWKVNWNTGHRVPAAFLEQMRREGRLQASSKGKEEPWLCPSHPANQQLEIAAMVEVARDYDVAGIHFDYIRYPDNDHCFCAGCRERFARATGAAVANWPADVLNAGPRRAAWLDWRRANIDTVVRAVSEQARAVRPTIKISAAVFRNWATDRDGVGQDWKLWCDRGWVDFVCPMDYTDNDRQFEAWVKQQKIWAGSVPVYPGIGVSSSHSRLPADRVIGQIEIARRHGLPGFTLFNYGAVESAELLPLLGLGTTAKR